MSPTCSVHDALCICISHKLIESFIRFKSFDEKINDRLRDLQNVKHCKELARNPASFNLPIL